ncbi:uncharacterized protein BN783_00518 [Odoribacter sp. CAG:788]|jgi:hypothetical protein|nr:uncharacterized protein BN783_00518 [Odoribacter sp. CAG:788]
MKKLTRLSKKAIEFCELSGYDVNKIRENMKSESFAFQICETREDMNDNGVDYNYPYVIFNPFNFDIEKEYD